MDQHGLTCYCLVALQHIRNTTHIPQQADTVVAFCNDVFVIVFMGMCMAFWKCVTFHLIPNAFAFSLL